MIGENLSLNPLVIRPDLNFDEFVKECNSLIEHHQIDLACSYLVQLLPTILLNPDIIDSAVPKQAGRHLIYEKAPGELAILGHYYPNEVASRPHNHGRTWAIYGVCTGRTAMYEWDLVEPAHDGERGKVRLTRSYWIMPGQAHYYRQGAIHSHHTYEDSRLIRIEGMNIKNRELKIGGKTFVSIET